MGRKNSSSDDNYTLKKLIAQYETAISENKNIYLDADQLADIADRYAFERKFDKAQEVITYGLKLHPNNTDLLVEQAYLFLDIRKISKAKAIADSIKEDYDANVIILKAEILLNEGQLETTRALLEKINDDDLDVITNIIYLYLDMGYPQETNLWIDKGRERYKDDEEFIAMTADCFYASNQLAEADNTFNRLIDMDPYNASYWVGLAKCRYTLQDFEKTIEACDFALAADDKAGEAYAFRAHSYFNLNNTDAALADYKEAIALKGLAPEAGYMFMGLVYTIKKEWAVADDCYRKVISIFKELGDEDSPILIDTYKNKAVAVCELGMFEEAHSLCKKAEKIDPQDSGTHLTQGMIYLKENKPKLARKSFDEALKFAPDAETWYQIGSFYSDFEMMEEAKASYDEAYRLNPKLPDLAEKLSIVSIIFGDIEGFFKYNKESAQPVDESFIQNALAEMSQPESKEILEDIWKRMKEEEKKDKNNLK